jgi:hypothetical protein
MERGDQFSEERVEGSDSERERWRSEETERVMACR